MISHSLDKETWYLEKLITHSIEKKLTEDDMVILVKQLMQKIRATHHNPFVTDIISAFILSVDKDYAKLVELLAKEQKSYSLEFLLANAVEKNATRSVCALLKARADVNVRACSWYSYSEQPTALHVAAKFGNHHCIKLLLEAKADPTPPPDSDPESTLNRQSTPMSTAILQYFLSGRSKKYRKSIEILSAADAKPSVDLLHLFDKKQDIQLKTRFLVMLEPFEPMYESRKQEFYKKEINISSKLDKGIQHAGKVLPTALLLLIKEYLDTDFNLDTDLNYQECYDKVSRQLEREKQLFSPCHFSSILIIAGFVWVVSKLFSGMMDVEVSPVSDAIKLGISFFVADAASIVQHSPIKNEPNKDQNNRNHFR
jgi:hypothetical protein